MKSIADLYKGLHKIPEPGFKEFKTREFILNNIPNGFKVYRVAKTGILVCWYGNRKHKNIEIGLRADMDGLPIEEETGLKYKSLHSGYMHACGHDAHMALLIKTMYLVKSENINRNILFIFQPAEEGPGGANHILKSKKFKKLIPKYIFALHIQPNLESGKIGLRKGPFLAATSEFKISIYGKEAHAISRSKCDAVLGLTELIYIIKNKYNNDKYIVHFGSIKGGKKANIVADFSQTKGTIRTFSNKDMIKIKKYLQDTIKNISNKRGLRFKIDYISEYPVLINNKKLVNRIKQFSNNIVELSTFFYGEDFAYFLNEIPGVFAFLGVKNKKSSGDLHTPNLKFDIKNLDFGVKYYMDIIKNI